MEASLATVKNQFPTLPQDAVKKIYKCRLERMKTLTCLGLPEPIRWIIEAKVHLGEQVMRSKMLRMLIKFVKIRCMFRIGLLRGYEMKDQP